MDLIKRNTDYTLRAMVALVKRQDHEPVSATVISAEQQIPYQLACKLLQRLQKHGFVTSKMGPKGGFKLSKPPSKVRLIDIVESIQGPLSVNKCLLGADKCPLQTKCPIRGKLSRLQEYMKNYLADITLDELAQTNEKPLRKRK